jgi:hypothetical protein
LSATAVKHVQEPPTASAAGSAEAGDSRQPTPYQPAAPDAAAASPDPVAHAPEDVHSNTGAEAAAQSGAGAGAAQAQPARRTLGKEELYEISQGAHRVQRQMSELLTERKPGADIYSVGCSMHEPGSVADVRALGAHSTSC